MKKSKIYVLGSINMDLLITADRTPDLGETISGKNFMQNAGGKGANQAVAAGKLGCDVTLISAVGDDLFGKEVLSQLKRNGISIEHICQKKEINTGIAMIFRTGGDNSIVLDAGANAYVTQEDVDKHLLGEQDDILMTQFEIPFEVAKYGIFKAKEKQMITIVNPTPAVPLSDELYQAIDYLVINQTECKVLTGSYPNTFEGCQTAGQYFLRKGVKNILITLGKHGSVFIDSEEIRTISSYQVDPIDSTGAGDAYIGALAFAVSNHFSKDQLLKTCSATGALACTKYGAQEAMPTYEEVKKLIEEQPNEHYETTNHN